MSVMFFKMKIYNNYIIVIIHNSKLTDLDHIQSSNSLFVLVFLLYTTTDSYNSHADQI